MPSESSPFGWVQTVLSRCGVQRVYFERRSETREPFDGDLAITWRDEERRARHEKVALLNYSDHGFAFRSTQELSSGRVIGIRRGDGICRGVVRHSRATGGGFVAGVRLHQTYRPPAAARPLELA